MVDSGAVPADGQLPCLGIVAEDGVAGGFIQGADQAVGISFAEIAIGKAMALALFPAVGHKKVVPVAVQTIMLPDKPRHTVQAPELILLSQLRAVGPGLVAVHEEPFRLPHGPGQLCPGIRQNSCRKRRPDAEHAAVRGKGRRSFQASGVRSGAKC